MDCSSLVGALRYCGRIRSIRHGKSFHSQFLKLGLSNDVFVANNLMSMYIDSESLTDAQNLFDEMPEKNHVTWGTILSAYVSFGKPHDAIELYNHMLVSESQTPNGFIYSSALKSCSLLGDLELGKLIHDRIHEYGLVYDTILMNTLLDMYVKCGSLSDARRVFDEIHLRTATSWNTMISGYCKEGQMGEALSLFCQMPVRNLVSWNSIISGFADRGGIKALDFVVLMHQEGLKLDGFTFPCALKICGSFGLPSFGKQIHGYVVKSGYDCNCFVASALIDMYSDCNELDNAIKLFDQYSCCGISVHEQLAIFNSIIAAYVLGGKNEAALSLLSKLHCLRAQLDSYTFSSALKACINLINLKLGLQVHGLIVTSGYGLDHVVGSILIDFYAKIGKIEDAFGLFHRLPRKDIIAWSSVIMGCANMGYHSLAFSLFKEMLISDIDVDEFILSCILKVCSSLASIKSGKLMHAFCLKSGYDLDSVIVTALIDMYSKCGNVEDSLKLFHSLRVRDVICWTGIILGCAQNGRPEEAIRLFYEMLRTGLVPNEITFLGVLAACRHTGLVEEAEAIFESMESEHGLQPHFEHYYCMIDLLGQAGHFKEAEELIASMPFKPDKTIWSSLLAACGNYKNAELVNRIAEKLLAAYPEDPSAYVMLSNVYASLGMWDNTCTVREAVKNIGPKESGKSWVEIAC